MTDDKIVLACVIARAEDVEAARSAAAAYMNAVCGNDEDRPENMLPTPLRAVGAGGVPPADRGHPQQRVRSAPSGRAATHWLCTNHYTEIGYAHMAAHIVMNNLPMESAIAASEEEFLAARGLKRIDG